MDNVEKRERLLLRIIHLVTAKYKMNAVLKGGMALRLYNSPRYTQDVDFVLLGTPSRTIIAKEVRKLLEQEEDIQVTNTKLHSRGIFINVQSETILVQIEISISKELFCPPSPLTTAALAAPLKMPAQIVNVMSRSESFAHKIAASLERNTMRDLYDLSLYEPNTDFDKFTLQQRLSQLCVNRKKPVSISFMEAGSRLKKRLENLKEKNVMRELKGLVPEHYLKGSLEVIRYSVLRLCQWLETTR